MGRWGTLWGGGDYGVMGGPMGWRGTCGELGGVLWGEGGAISVSRGVLWGVVGRPMGSWRFLWGDVRAGGGGPMGWRWGSYGEMGTSYREMRGSYGEIGGVLWGRG